MQSDSWGPVSQQLTPNLGRYSHQRESSLSSLGSTGPISPYSHNTMNPQIAITNSPNDRLSELNHGDFASASNVGSYYQLAKAMGSFAGYQTLDGSMPDMAYPMAVQGTSMKHCGDRGLLPAPDFAGTSNRSHPTSVTSSVTGDSPTTPSMGGAENMDRRRRDVSNVPKLDRTMTDVYGDELYSPNFSITASSSSRLNTNASPNSDIFSQRINAANSQHLSTAQSPSSVTSRDRSPFRAESPFTVSSTHDYNRSHDGTPFNSAQRMREQEKSRQEMRLLQQQFSRGREPDTPKTISPKDAMLEFQDTESDGNFSLFPDGTAAFDIGQLTTGCSPTENGEMNTGTEVAYLPSQMSMGIQVPQQYPFIARTQPTNTTSPPRLSSASSSSNGSRGPTPVRSSADARPEGSGASSGTYTCTYHGCTLRFETPILLQKHKREGHRQTHNLGVSRQQDFGLQSSPVNSQAGPHRCDRINPSTGKPCGTVFSRPYDLTRHEDTIHNGRKQKVHCNICTEEKTFSRADALTRHYRVCHPDVDLPGKRRKRTAS